MACFVTNSTCTLPRVMNIHITKLKRALQLVSHIYSSLLINVTRENVPLVMLFQASTWKLLCSNSHGIRRLFLALPNGGPLILLTCVEISSPCFYGQHTVQYANVGFINENVLPLCFHLLFIRQPSSYIIFPVRQDCLSTQTLPCCCHCRHKVLHTTLFLQHTIFLL